jgi:hypothetical protein
MQGVRPPLWSIGQSWLQIPRSGFDSRRYQSFRGVVGLERGPLNVVSTIEELLGRKNSGSGLEKRSYGRRGSIALTTRRNKLALTSSISGGRTIGVVRSRTEGRMRNCDVVVRSALWVSNFMELSTAATRDIFSIPWNPKMYYRIRKCFPLLLS